MAANFEYTDTHQDTMKHVLSRQRNTGPWRLLLIVAGLIVMLASLGGIYADYHLGSSWMHVQAALVTFLAVSFIVAARFGVGSAYLFSTSYFLVFGLFHVSHTFLHAFGIYDFKEYATGDHRRTFEIAGWYVLVAMSCFCIGVAAGWKRMSRNLASAERKTLSLADAYWAGMGLLAASAILFGLTWIQVGNIFRYSRAQIFGGVGDTRGFGVFLMVFPSALALLVLGSRKYSQRIFAFGITGAGILFIMFLGYRSAALFPLLVGTIVWKRIGRRIPITLVATGLVAILVLIPSVSYLRQVGSYENLTTADVAKSFAVTKSTDTFLELGNINGIVADVVDWIPAEEPYRYGRSYLKAFTNAIPNFGTEISASERARLKKNSYSAELAMSMSPSDWYIYKVNRWMFDTGGGAGFSAVAEAYLNFGVAGVLLIFILYGFILGKLDQMDLLARSWRIILVSSILWPFITIVRNDFETFVKPASFILITLIIWHFSTPWIAKLWRQRLVRNLAISARNR